MEWDFSWGCSSGAGTEARLVPAEEAPHTAETGRAISSLLARIVSGIGNVAGRHLELVRSELQEDLRAAGRHLTALAIGGLLAMCGLLLLGVAVALILAKALDNPAAGFGIVGVVCLAAGGLAGLWGWRRALSRSYLSESRRELKESKRWLQEEILPPPGPRPSD